MKIRTGFVSNSSSSSFIIAIPKWVLRSHRWGYANHEFEKFAESSNILEKGDGISILNNLDSWVSSVDALLDVAEYNDEKDARESEPDTVKLLEEGWVIGMGDIPGGGDGGTPDENRIRNLLTEGRIIISNDSIIFRQG